MISPALTRSGVAAVLVLGAATAVGPGPAAVGTTPPARPAAVLDLTNWKLTVPTAGPGSRTAMEIRQPDLSTYNDDPLFTTRGSTVQFRAPVGGATTKGSDYPRSELREMTYGGTTEASWSTRSGIHTMVVTESATHLPSVKAQVVTAQVHNASDDVIEVVADGTRSSQPGVYSICLRYKGKTRTPCMDTAYAAGHPYTIRIAAAGGHLQVFYNGTQKYDLATNQSGCYFKAGAYTQSNPSKGDRPDDYGQVLISALSVTRT